MFKWFRREKGPRAPDPQFSEELARRIIAAADANKLTPDIMRLQQRRAQCLFVGDEMMEKLPRHDLIREHSVPLGRCFTQEPFTHMRYQEPEMKGAITVAIRKQFNTVPYLPILGQLYAVLPDHFRELDKYKRSVGYFDRVRVKLTFVHRRKDMVAFPLYEEIGAHMYIGVKDYWLDKFDGGYTTQPVRCFGKRNTPAYSFYSRLEVNESLNSS